MDAFHFILENPLPNSSDKPRKRARLITACDSCRVKKIKCRQHAPDACCEACNLAKIPCVFGDRDRYQAERGVAYTWNPTPLEETLAYTEPEVPSRKRKMSYSPPAFYQWRSPASVPSSPSATPPASFVSNYTHLSALRPEFQWGSSNLDDPHAFPMQGRPYAGRQGMPMRQSSDGYWGGKAARLRDHSKPGHVLPLQPPFLSRTDEERPRTSRALSSPDLFTAPPNTNWLLRPSLIDDTASDTSSSFLSSSSDLSPRLLPSKNAPSSLGTSPLVYPMDDHPVKVNGLLRSSEVFNPDLVKQEEVYGMHDFYEESSAVQLSSGDHVPFPANSSPPKRAPWPSKLSSTNDWCIFLRDAILEQTLI